MDFSMLLPKVFIYGVPLLLAITLHEAAHGFVAYWYGDMTAYRQGRVSLNPFRHIDPVGTVLIPGILVLSHAPFLFGYAKPVPVVEQRLRNPRFDMVKVAIAGPATNLLLAIVSAYVLRTLYFWPQWLQPHLAEMLVFSISLNVMLALFNMLPLPPLDGGRVAVGLLPGFLSRPLARVEPYGMMILIGAIFLLPLILQQFNIRFNLLSWLLGEPRRVTLEFIKSLTGL